MPASLLSLLATAALSTGLAAPRTLAGLDWVPAGRGDLEWVAQGQGSGTLVGELDGLLRPPLSAWAGPAWDKDAVIFGLGVARQATSTWTSQQKTHVALGSVRPSVDYRRYLRPREAGQATAWLGAGVHGNIPWVRYTSESWTAEEQAAMDEAAAADRGRIGGLGGRLGLGAEAWLTESLAVGGSWSGRLHRQQYNGTDGYTVSTWVGGEAALTLALQL